MSSLPSAHSITEAPAFLRLKEFIIRSTGLSYYQDKDNDLAERVARRLSALSISDIEKYLSLLAGASGERELDELVAELTIGETYFFRHTEQFDALRDIVLPECIQRNLKQRRLRIWSAGCSSGAEAYSVAIMLRTQFAHPLTGWDVSILGTDINKEVLARAQRGVFEEWAFRTTPDDVRQRCFSRQGKSWALAPEFKAGVSFQYHNLIAQPCPSQIHNLRDFDVILCRNVMIYFSQDDFRAVVGRLEQCLVDGGWLLVGHSEPHVETFRSFRMVSVPGAILYQRSATQVSTPETAPWMPPTLSLRGFDSPAMDTNVPSASSVASAQAISSPKRAVRKSLDVAGVRQRIDAGEWDKASEYCAKFLQQDKVNTEAHFLQALILEQLGQHGESEQALRRVIYLDRNCVLAHYYLALRLQTNRDYRGARQSFENVLRLLPSLDAGHVFADADGITAADMKQLAETHLEILVHHA